MLDPEIFDSADSKGWTAYDFLVMVTAICTADDEGRGRISQVKKNAMGMISDKNFRKSLKNLGDSIVIYSEIYFFLPKFKNYQTISHPKPSKFPEPNYQGNKDLVTKTSINSMEAIQNPSILSKSKLINLKEVNADSPVDNSVNSSLPTSEPSLLFNNHSSFTFYEDCLPFDFSDTDSVRNSITKLIAKFCNGTAPTKSEITRIFNIVTGTRGARRDTCFKITAQTLSEFSSLSPEKKNFAYLSQRIEGKISDAMIKAKEIAAAKLKEDERTEIENMSGKINDVDLNVIANKLTFK